MLTWVGKKPLRHAIAYPAQLVESFNVQSSIKNRKSEIWTDWPKDIPQTGLLFHGDNKEVLAHLLANGFRGKVKLIYIDPPFDSGADYVRKVSLRSSNGTSLFDSESYTLGEQVQYTDIWANDNYLQFVYERLSLIKELLDEDGTFWLHCDYRQSHYLKCLCDEVFNRNNFVTEIVWKRSMPRGNVQHGLSVANDSVLVYSKGIEPKWHPPLLPYSDEYMARFTNKDKNGRHYVLDSLISPNPDRPNLDYVWNGVRKVWRVTKDKMAEYEKQGRLEYTSNRIARFKRYMDELKGRPLTTIWDDIFPVNSQADEREDYPTQKPEALLERIIATGTDGGDIVLDCFLGSGTTAVIAQKLGRRWIGADINKGAIQTTAKRLQSVIQERVESAKSKTQTLPGLEDEETPSPAQLGFAVYRVNDYDLQIQHNEAFNLAVEHLGMARTKTDAFFDGTLGKKLVKIVPFNHPVTPLDLEEVRRELNNRPDEERDIVLVGLGKEVAIEAWLDECNKLRKQGNIPNKIEVIELRSDPKYGGFFTHEPAKAKASFKRTDKGVEITIDDFISPTILERLKQQNKHNPLFQPQVNDWRSMVDSVIIDSAFDGKVFNITLADIPEKKKDLVDGKYVVEAKKGATIAVKVTDMLGEEVLVIKSS
ncbi:MAG: site-specific DNA-methyltransferase [Chloroflexi bacterium]|nr:site-specific DNA-methyltransferase [Chloroflexota bacterium]